MKDGQDVRLLLSVVRAYDVPVRSEADPMQSAISLQHHHSTAASAGATGTGQGGSMAEMRDGGYREALVSSYVEARFQVGIRTAIFLQLRAFLQLGLLIYDNKKISVGPC